MVSSVSKRGGAVFRSVREIRDFLLQEGYPGSVSMSSVRRLVESGRIYAYRPTGKFGRVIAPVWAVQDFLEEVTHS